MCFCVYYYPLQKEIPLLKLEGFIDLCVQQYVIRSFLLSHDLCCSVFLSLLSLSAMNSNSENGFKSNKNSGYFLNIHVTVVAVVTSYIQVVL